MQTVKKALSIALCAIMLITTLCFFPITNVGLKADAAVVKADNSVAFYAPEVIYLYPDVVSWKEAVATPFQYYVSNTVDTENIFNAPAVSADTETVGEIYFASEEDISDVSLSVKFMDKNGDYYDDNSAFVEATAEDKGEYYLFTVTNSKSPVLQASESGCYVQWIVTYKTSMGETKSAIRYSYVYKPFVVPYGAATRVFNEKGDVNVYGQHLTWITGVHSIDTTAASANVLYPIYRTVSSSSSNSFAFSPFLSRGNKAYVGGVETEGAAAVENGSYNAVFAGTDPEIAYFFAGQSSAGINSSIKVRSFFGVSAGTTTYSYGSFDYMNGSTVSAQYAVSQVTPTRLGSILIDTSRYNNLNEIPNLAVGFMITDTDVSDAVTTNTPMAAAQWYIGDATENTHAATGAYNTQDAYIAAFTAVNNKFVYKESLTAPMTLGIKYAGSWDKEIDKTVTNKKYTIKTYYESVDRENDRQVASAAVSLNAVQYDKTYLRAAVDNAASYFGVLGVTADGNSIYYDYTTEAWQSFISKHEEASMALTSVDEEYEYNLLAIELTDALNVLLSGTALKVYFNENHDGIAPENFKVIEGTTYGELPTASRDGYIFSGWYSDEALTEEITADSAVSSKMLYAKWTPIEYNVVFNGNSSTAGEMAKDTFTYDEAGNLSLNTFAKTGYTFSHWEDADGNVYSDGAEVINLASESGAEVTLYAQWNKNYYSVALNGNTGVGGIGMMTCIYDEDFTLPANYFIKTGYTFIGWALTPDGEVVLEDGAEFRNLTAEVDGSVTLYAVWQANSFTVVFDKTSGNGTMEDAVVSYDSEVYPPDCEYTKTGYSFAGWSLSADSNEVITAAQYDNLCTEEGDTVTLYAVWSENSYTLTFDKNGGTGENIPATVYNYEATILLPKDVFARTGYVLEGWSLTKDGEIAYLNGETVKHLNADKDGKITLYAVWSPISYKIRFNATTAEGTMADIDATYDVTVNLTANQFTKEGYHFVGWAKTQNGNATYTDAQAVVNLSSEEGAVVNLYAVWQINTYTVTFEFYNGNGDFISRDVNVQHGKAAEIPDDFAENPYYSGTQHRIFDSWSKDFSNVTGNMTVSALYSGRENHEMLSRVENSTCAKEGATVYYCSKCSYSYSIPIAKLPHTWDEGRVEKEPECVVDGIYLYVCTACGATKDEAIDSVGHSFVPFAAADSTCSVQGNIAHKHCENCEKCYATDADEMAPYSEALDDAEVKLPLLPHTSGGKATCTEEETCTVCGAKMSDALGHTEVISYITNSATCVTEGAYIEKVTCEVCSATISAVDKYGKIPHNYEKTVVAPTCTEDGYTLYTCSVCSDSYTDETIVAAGHTKGSWVVTTPAKCEEGGIATLYCADCGTALETKETAPKGHGVCNWTITTEPGCESTGVNSYICKDCGVATKQESVAALGHNEGPAETCETDKTCLRCGEVLKEAYGHSWDNGTVTKEPTETETGIREFTCNNDASHKKYEDIPVRIVIVLPEIPADGTYDLDADENSYAGNISDIITVEEGMEFTVTSSDESLITVDAEGNINVYSDGEAVLTITTTDGKYSKQLRVALRVLKTVEFDVNSVITTVKHYVGDKAQAPETPDYTDGEGFVHSFKTWSLDGKHTDDLTVTGNMKFVAVYTSKCDYRELDRLSEMFNEVISGSYDNSVQINLNKAAVDEISAKITLYAADRNTRDKDEQAAINKLVNDITEIIAVLYPENLSSLEIRGNTQCNAGAAIDFSVYLLPVETKVSRIIWSVSDSTIGFMDGNTFHAMLPGTVTLTATSGNLTASVEITVNGAVAARVIMFDTLLTNVNYIVEGSYVIKSTTNIFWAPDAALRFRVITPGDFEEYYVCLNNVIVEPDENGVYTIPANCGDVQVRAEGVVKDEEGTKLSIWDAILNFFKKIADFFKNLFS